MAMTVLCFGTFDGLHPGHEDYFRQAKTYGDTLVVVVARDETVKAVKGHVPRQNEEARLKAVRACTWIDDAYLGEPGDKYHIIETIRPDVIVLGYDQDSFTDGLMKALRERGLSCKVVRAQAYKSDVYKSSLLNKTSVNNL